MSSPSPLQPYADGRWFPNEHRVSTRFPLLCRGNTGEVYPNVVTPLTASIVRVPFALGQRSLALDLGMATPDQLTEFDGERTAMASMHAGYLYANVSLARSAVARTPGLTADIVDRQMFGLTDAPPYERGPGDRSVRAAARASRVIGAALFRPDGSRLATDRARVTAFVDSAPEPDDAEDVELLDVVHRADPMLERLMHSLLRASALAGVSRSMLERVVAAIGDDDLVNRLTAGLGTIESAEPATDLWRLGRLVADDPELTELFDAGLSDLDQRLRSSPTPSVDGFVSALAAFRSRHGSRGPDEWELASPTWGSDSRLALGMVDRLRNAPPDRDPLAVGERLGHERDDLRVEVRDQLGPFRRPAFDIAIRATAEYQAQREATKAAFVRLLHPIRRALAELGRRSGLDHHDFFLLNVDEVPAALRDRSALTSTVAERRARRDYLQARVPPFWFMGPVPPPSTWELRRQQLRPDTRPRTLHGLGVCSGTAAGTARVVTDPAEADALEPGDILIAPLTDPAWTPLFLAVAGVVVDVGAQQSHAAIVARELGIPAVVSVAGASSSIPDGTHITVDGSSGTVTISPPEGGGP